MICRLEYKCLVRFFNRLRHFRSSCFEPKLEQPVKGRRLSAIGVLAGLNRSDDLSELTVGFHVAVCFDNLVEWKDSVDDWLQGPFV
jgi:hypothetical protein